MSMTFLCRRIEATDGDRDGEGYKLGAWQRVEAGTIAAATFDFMHGQMCSAVLARGAEREAVFVLSPDGVSEINGWERGGPLLCLTPCGECNEDHHLSEVYSEDHHANPQHEANTRGVDAWIPCKHCDAWVEYDYGEGVVVAIGDALGAN